MNDNRQTYTIFQWINLARRNEKGQELRGTGSYEKQWASRLSKGKLRKLDRSHIHDVLSSPIWNINPFDTATDETYRKVNRSLQHSVGHICNQQQHYRLNDTIIYLTNKPITWQNHWYFNLPDIEQTDPEQHLSALWILYIENKLRVKQESLLRILRS